MAQNISSRDINKEILLVWDLLRPHEALKKFKKTLEEFPDIAHKEKIHRKSKDDKTLLNQIHRGQVLTQLARAQGQTKEFDEAHGSLDVAEGIMKGISDNPASNSLVRQDFSALKTRIELERGRLFNSSGDPTSSVFHFQDALILAFNSTASGVHDGTSTKEGENFEEQHTSALQYLTVDALHMLALVEGSEEQRAAYAKRVLEIVEREDTDAVTKRWLGPLLSSVAWDALENGEFEKAISLFLRAVAVRRDALDNFDYKESSEILSEADMAEIKENRITTWKIARWSAGHAQMVAGKEDEALNTLTGILADGLDGPAIRADLAILTAKRNESSTIEHARRAIVLGVSKEKVAELDAIISRFHT